MAAMLPFVLGWMAWVKLYRAAPSDIATRYNTDYLGFFLKELQLSDVPTLVWENQGRLLYAMGTLVFPLEYDSMLLVMLRITAAVGILHGLWLQRRNRVLWFFLAFAGLMVVELLAWNFPPNLRLMYPLVPLVVAGLVFESQHIAHLFRDALRHKDRSQRIAAGLLGVAFGMPGVMALWMQVEMSFTQLPALADEQVRVRTESEAAFAWIAGHTEASANVLCLNPALYLYTGRWAESIFPLPIYWYRKDGQGTLLPFRTLAAQSAHLMEYFYVHESDLNALAPGQAEELKKLLQASTDLKPVYQGNRGVVYQLAQRPVAASKAP